MKYFLKIFFILIFYSCNSNKVKSNEKDSIRNYKQFDSVLSEKAKPAYVQASVQIQKLKQYIDLAKKGTLSKKDVVNEYNNSVGQQLVSISTFDVLENNIDSIGEIYVKLMFEKAKLDIAMQVKAEAKFSSDTTK